MYFLKLIYKSVKKIVEALGFNIVITKKYKSENSYESILPTASYAPWLDDNEFIEVYKIIEQYTLVDKYRCYELWQLVKQTAKLDGALLEVGVWKGGTGALISKSAQISNIKNSVYLCDTFSGVVKAGEKDTAYKGGEHADTSAEKVEKLISKLKLKNTKILIGMFPEDTAKNVLDKKFRFCHIDVDVYQSSKDTVNWIWEKLVVGGMIVFDDYGFTGCDGVTKYVNELSKRRDLIVIHNLNGHAVVIKIK